MDIEKWKKYEEKEKDIRNIYKKKRLIVWIVWLIAFLVVNTVLFLVKDIIGIQIMLTAMLVFTLISFFIALKKTTEWFRAEKQQVDLLHQDEPFLKFKT